MSGTGNEAGSMASRRPGSRGRFDPAVLIAFGCIVALLLLGSLYSTSFLSPAYLLQQLQVASFLGLIATVGGYLVEVGCDLALISGTTRQLKLYRHLGFEPFGPLVGTPGAMFQPMYLTRQKFKEFSRGMLPSLRSDDGFGAVSILPVYPAPGRPAIRLIATAEKGGGAPLRLLPPLALNDGGMRPTREAEAVLRRGAALPTADL